MSVPELVLPPGVDRPLPEVAVQRGMIVNETDLPDYAVQTALEVYFEENASMLGVNGASSFQTYANSGGSILARGRYKTPSNVLEEIILARDLAERDDDIGATMGSMFGIAFEEGMQNNHEDEVTVALFNEIARLSNLDGAFLELYREWLIAYQFTTATAWVAEDVSYMPADGERTRNRTIASPRIGVLPAENVLPIGNDMFGTAPLFYRPATGDQEIWLREFFSPSTTAARKAEMRREDPVLTTLLLEERKLDDQALRVNSLYELDKPNPPSGEFVYRLNPRMVHRTTGPKGGWAHPRPLLTRNFPLLEAKRLLNLMDYALLEGGANFLVVAKKGTDQRPAQQPELENLRDQIKRAARSGVLIGDHRVSIEIITPDLAELLNHEKRRLLSRKLSRALLRLPDYAPGGAETGTSGQAALTDTEIVSRVIGLDRRAIKRHVENHIYREAALRNGPIQDAASIWFAKIILQGSQYFTDLVLKLRDRGDISRKSAVEAGGFSYQAELQQRKREKANGDDRVLTPAVVPFNGPGGAPVDNAGGRPPGSGPDNGRPGARPGRPGEGSTSRTAARSAGENVRAMFEHGTGAFRAGELTYALLEEYADTKQVGRITSRERDALARIEGGERESFQEGALTIVPVNAAYEIGDVRAVRLTQGLSVLVGNRTGDGAVLSRALVFRAPEWTDMRAEEQAIAWGYTPVEPPETRVVAVVDELGGQVVGHAVVQS